MIFYFSGTGNSAWAARKLANMLNDTLVNMAIHHDTTYELAPNERVGFVFPVYAWGPPTLVIDFIQRVKLENPHYLYFVCTCGDDTGKTYDVFKQAVEKRGWTCRAGYSITMPNTYVSLPGFDVDPKELEEFKIKNAASSIQYIANEVLQYSTDNHNCHEGSFPRLKTYFIRPLFNHFLMSSQPFHATDACTACHRCEMKCPVQNIKVTDKPQWGNHCTQCLACYHECPSHAIQYGNRTKGKGQYKGEGLKD